MNSTQTNKKLTGLNAVMMKVKIAKGIIATPEYGVVKPVTDKAEWSKADTKVYAAYEALALECREFGIDAVAVPPSYVIRQYDDFPMGKRDNFGPIFRITIPGVQYHSISVDAEQEYGPSPSQWRSGPALDTYALLVHGNDGDGFKKRRFPSNKKLGHNYKKAAELINACVRAVETKRDYDNAAVNAKNSNADIVAKLKAEFGLKEYDDKICASYGYHINNGSKNREWREAVAPTGKVFLKVGTLTVTEEHARKINSFINATMLNIETKGE